MLCISITVIGAPRDFEGKSIKVKEIIVNHYIVLL